MKLLRNWAIYEYSAHNNSSEGFPNNIKMLVFNEKLDFPHFNHHSDMHIIQSHPGSELHN